MTAEKESVKYNGWPVLWLLIIVLLASIAGFIYGIVLVKSNQPGVWLIVTGLLVFLLTIFLLAGLFMVEPNQARVLILFGKYIGTEKTTGFRWANPLLDKKTVSLRARNFDSEKLKVNDKKGNPIEISAVIVWRVQNTAQAVFDVDNYKDYVRVQSESAIRHLATSYPYDTSEGETVSLRTSIDEVSEGLKTEIQERVDTAGVVIDEARINHLAYAAEIAQAMLQRQQAEAIIAARKKIVEGAVSMVQMALHRLKDEDVISLDEERKANMVSNLMVVLCSEKSTSPVINTGSLY